MAVIQSSFYVTGGTLKRDAQSYVRRQADETLYEAINRSKFCYVLTSRQMGKSSLMVRTATRLREDVVAVAVVDLTALGQNLSPEQWYGSLLSRIGEQLRLEDELEDFWRDNARFSPLQRLMRAIQEVVLTKRAGRVVIFIDEIDAVRSLPFSTDELFAGIREFYNRRTEDAELNRLTFCLLGVATPSDLIQDTRTTPFNIGQRIELTDFTEAEALPLAEGLRRESGASVKLLQRIVWWTNGHPYLTQRLCQAVAEDGSVQGDSGVDRLCNDLFLSSSARAEDDNLRFVSNRMLRSEADLASLLDTYRQVLKGKKVSDDKANPLASILRLSGIARVEDGNLKLRNRIYEQVFNEEWVKANMPDAEVRRQRAAYRKGMFRATAIAAVILAVMTGLVLTAFSQYSRAEEEKQRAEKAVEELKMALIKVEEEKQRADEKTQEALLQREEADRQRDMARKKTGEAEEQRRLAVESQETAEQRRLDAERQKGLAVEQKEFADRLLYGAQIRLAQQAYESGNALLFQEMMAKKVEDKEEDLRGFEWSFLQHHSVKTLKTGAYANSVAFSPDGKRLATASFDGTVKLWDASVWQDKQLANQANHN